ncbi:MAG: CvpA family protein [Lachnospiraceae bacterium]|nr:CvpA family protein [Lachnospiraceae bacterium]
MKYILITVFIAILAAMTVMGYHKGFLKTLVSMLSILLSILFVYFFSGPVTKLIDSNTGLRETIRQSVYEKLLERSEEEAAVTDEQQQAVADDSFIPGVILEAFNGETNPFGTQEDYNTRLSVHIADLAMKAAGMLVTLVLAFILIRILMGVAGVMNRIPLLGSVNRVLGAAIGLVQGLLILWVLCLAITAAGSTGLGSSCLEAIGESRILSAFYNGSLSLQGILGSL